MSDVYGLSQSTKDKLEELIRDEKHTVRFHPAGGKGKQVAFIKITFMYEDDFPKYDGKPTLYNTADENYLEFETCKVVSCDGKLLKVGMHYLGIRFADWVEDETVIPLFVVFTQPWQNAGTTIDDASTKYNLTGLWTDAGTGTEAYPHGSFNRIPVPTDGTKKMITLKSGQMDFQAMGISGNKVVVDSYSGTTYTFSFQDGLLTNFVIT